LAVFLVFSVESAFFVFAVDGVLLAWALSESGAGVVFLDEEDAGLAIVGELHRLGCWGVTKGAVHRKVFMQWM
jgi:hypothetical protein